MGKARCGGGPSNLLHACAGGEAAGAGGGGLGGGSAGAAKDFGGEGFVLLAVAICGVVGIRSGIWSGGIRGSSPWWIICWRSTATLPPPLLPLATMMRDGPRWQRSFGQYGCWVGKEIPDLQVAGLLVILLFDVRKEMAVCGLRLAILQSPTAARRRILAARQ